MDDSDRIVVSTCYGPHWAYCRRWAGHTHFKSNLPIHVLSVDGQHLDDDFGDGVSVHPVPVPSPDRRNAELCRMEFIVDRLAAGISCAQIDFDVLLKQDIAGLFALDADFIISRAFGQPDFMSDKFGFVACMGFFIAKPASAELVAETAASIRERPWGDDPELIPDQVVLNRLFFDEIARGAMKPFPPTADVAEGSDESHSVSDYRGMKVCVLARETILRGANLAKSTFGNHHRSVLSLFGPA
jgi:Nucleotide-diphospho-sugar transferase